jgi:O-antigen ligase
MLTKSSTRSASATNQQILSLVIFFSVALAAAYIISNAQVGPAFLVAAGLMVAVLAFLRMELAIHLLIISMLLSPELSLGGAGGAGGGKGITLRTDDILLVIVGASWFLKSALYKELNLLRETPLNKAAAFYALACIFPTMLGMMAGRVRVATGSLFVIKYLEYFLIFWMIINATRDTKQVRRFLLVVFAVALVVSITAIAQIPSGVRVTAPFEGEQGEPNTLAGYLLFIIALLLGISITSPNYRKTAVVLLAITIIPFMYTLSRNSYLAFLPMALVLFYLTRRYKLIWATVGLTAALFVFPFVLPKVVVERIQYTFEKTEKKQGIGALRGRFDPSTTARLESFSASMDAFMEKPLFGWGVTGWGFIDSQYFRTLVETGIIGLAALVFLIFKVLRMGLATVEYFRSREPLFFGLSAGFVAGTVGLVIHAIGANTFIIVRIMEPFWLLCGFIFMLPQLPPSTDKATLLRWQSIQKSISSDVRAPQSEPRP